MGSIAGGLTSISSVYQSVQDKVQGAGNYQLAQLSAADAIQRGNLAAAQVQAKGTEAIAGAKVGFSTSGVDAQTGSALTAMVDSRMMSELDALTLRNNAAREAWGYKVQGTQALTQGAVNSARDMNSAYGSLLGGVTSDVGTAVGLGTSLGSLKRMGG